MRGGDVEEEEEGSKKMQPHFVGLLSQDGRSCQKRKSVGMLKSTEKSVVVVKE